jgi:hypothetical protein
VSTEAPQQSVTTQLSLADQQMGIISSRIRTIQFFDYPSQLFSVPADQRVVAEIHPSATYRLEVRDGGLTHTVAWNDSHRSETSDAVRLRNLFALMIQMIHDHPEFKRLPPTVGGCE